MQNEDIYLLSELWPVGSTTQQMEHEDSAEVRVGACHHQTDHHSKAGSIWPERAPSPQNRLTRQANSDAP